LSSTDLDLDETSRLIVERAVNRFHRWRTGRLIATDRLFAKLFIGEWLFAVAIALVFSPYGWTGKVKVLHFHVWIALLLGGAIISFPLLMIRQRPGAAATRHVVAVAQALMSALLIHLSGGRIETHFHVFGSLAILAFYLDWKVLVTATLVVAGDHLVRGLVWPESVYGIVNPEWWRFLEHAFWVLFCISFLAISCTQTIKTWLQFAEEGGMMEALAESEWRKSSVVERAAEEAAKANP
jgi:two-component system, NtrC family, sensor histidine kinase HydH